MQLIMKASIIIRKTIVNRNYNFWDVNAVFFQRSLAHVANFHKRLVLLKRKPSNTYSGLVSCLNLRPSRSLLSCISKVFLSPHKTWAHYPSFGEWTTTFLPFQLLVYRKASSRGAHGHVPFWRASTWFHNNRYYNGTIHIIDNVIVLSDLVESSGYSSKTLQKGSCP